MKTGGLKGHDNNEDTTSVTAAEGRDGKDTRCSLMKCLSCPLGNLLNSKDTKEHQVDGDGSTAKARSLAIQSMETGDEDDEAEDGSTAKARSLAIKSMETEDEDEYKHKQEECALCFGNEKCLAMKCCTHFGELFYCKNCLKGIAQEYEAYNEDDTVGICPRCRSTFIISDDDNGTSVLQRENRRGKCMRCMQMHDLVTGSSYCSACLFGDLYCLRYQCDKCHNYQSIAYPLWISQISADTYSRSSWACHVGCYDYRHWSVNLDDLREQVPMKHWPSWFVLQHSTEQENKHAGVPATRIAGPKREKKSREKGVSANSMLELPPKDLSVYLPFDKQRCLVPSWMTQQKDVAMGKSSPLPKGCQVWYVTFEGKYDWYVKARIKDFVLNGNEVVAYLLSLDEPIIEKTSSDKRVMRRWKALQRKIEEELSQNVAPSKIIERWDEIEPISPMEYHHNSEEKDASFGGANQKGKDPPLWGITLEQMKEVMNHPKFRKNNYVYGKLVKRGFSMYDVVTHIIKPATQGKGMGYSLMKNQDKPLKANIMISHAWSEDYESFIQAIEDSGETGPFWVCAFAIYQPEDIPELTIEKQLGEDPKRGPFAVVLSQVSKMLGIVTRSCDIYTRLWCVYEIYVAISYNVPINIVYTSEKQGDKTLGTVYLNAGLELSNVAIATEKAHCGFERDAEMIRNDVKSLEGGFAFLNRSICWIKAMSLIEARDRMVGDEKGQEVPLGICTTSCAQARLNAGIAIVISQLTVNTPKENTQLIMEDNQLAEGIYKIKTTKHESTGMVANRGLSAMMINDCVRNSVSSWISVYDGEEWPCLWEIKKGSAPGTYQINTMGHEAGQQEEGWGLCAHYDSSKRDKYSLRICAHSYEGNWPIDWKIVPGNKHGTWRILTTEVAKLGQPGGWGLSAWGEKIPDGIQNEESSWVYAHCKDSFQMDWHFEEQ